MAGSDRLLTLPGLTPKTRPGWFHVRVAFLVVAILATFSSAVVTRDTIAATQIAALPATFNRPCPALISDSGIPLLSKRAVPGAANGKRELRATARSPASGGGSPEDGEPPPRSSDRGSAKASTTMTRTATAPGGRPAPTDDVGSSPLPSPFDNAPASQFKSDGAGDSCPNFMSALMSNSTFKSCYPLSMMLQTSTSLFLAEKTLLGTVRVLDATCKADSASCATFFDAASRNLTSDQNCKREVDGNQTMVLQAYRGLKAYKMLYAATCLQDPSTNQYCFASAVTNLHTPSDVYLYFMPYGLSLPGSSTPSCSWCTQQTMAIYHAAAQDHKQFIAGTYEDAASQVNTLCGPNFVNSTLPAAVSAALGLAPASANVLATLCAAVVFLTLML